MSRRSSECINRAQQRPCPDHSRNTRIGCITQNRLRLLKGLITGKLRTAEVKSILNGVLTGGKTAEHYAALPQTPDGLDEWVKKADELWQKAGRMPDRRLLD